MSGSVLRGTSSATRTMDEREIAALRPATAPPVRQRKPAEPRREITSGIECFCGERFAESQALEFMLHLRAEVGEELALVSRVRARRRKDEKRKWNQNPRYQERHKEYMRAYRAKVREQHETGNHSQCPRGSCRVRRNVG